jgi:hypothetical protein
MLHHVYLSLLLLLLTVGYLFNDFLLLLLLCLLHDSLLLLLFSGRAILLSYVFGLFCVAAVAYFCLSVAAVA